MSFIDEEKEKLEQLDPTYKEWYLSFLKKNTEYNDIKKREWLLNMVVEQDLRDKKNIEHTTGYICVQKVKFIKNLGSWTLPVQREEPNAPAYLLHKDRISFTRNIEDAMLIEGSRGRERVELDFVSNGYWYRFIPRSEALNFLGAFPPLRKAISKQERMTTYQKFNGRCAYCGCELKYEEMEVDHFVSHMSNFGEDDISNYMPACHDCNHVKVNYSINQFKKAIRHCGEIHRARKKPMLAISDRIAVKYDLADKDHEITFLYEKEAKQ